MKRTWKSKVFQLKKCSGSNAFRVVWILWTFFLKKITSEAVLRYLPNCVSLSSGINLHKKSIFWFLELKKFVKISFLTSLDLFENSIKMNFETNSIYKAITTHCMHYDIKSICIFLNFKSAKIRRLKVASLKVYYMKIQFNLFED